jgi:hypothetical protein
MNVPRRATDTYFALARPEKCAAVALGKKRQKGATGESRGEPAREFANKKHAKRRLDKNSRTIAHPFIRGFTSAREHANPYTPCV